MTKQGLGAATKLVPCMAAIAIATSGCASSYPELRREIDQAVAAAQPTAADSAAAAGRVAAAAPANGAAAGQNPGAALGPAAAGTPMGSAATPGVPVMPAGPSATRITTVANLASPEAVVIDTAGGVILVAGSETVAGASRGVIMQLALDGTVREGRWIAGGRGTTRLNAPRGMVIVADTLWVVDGSVLRGFHRKTGRTVATIGTRAIGGVSLTDVAVGGDGALYLTDAAVTFTSRGVAQRHGSGKIIRVEGRTPTVALEHDRLVQPRGLSWDPIMSRLLIGGGGSDTVMAWRPGQDAPEPVVVASGPWDDVVAIGGTSFYALSTARGEVHHFQNGVGRAVITTARGAGDVALDARGGRLIVPYPSEQRVEIWEVRR